MSAQVLGRILPVTPIVLTMLVGCKNLATPTPEELRIAAAHTEPIVRCDQLGAPSPELPQHLRAPPEYLRSIELSANEATLFKNLRIWFEDRGHPLVHAGIVPDYLEFKLRQWPEDHDYQYAPDDPGVPIMIRARRYRLSLRRQGGKVSGAVERVGCAPQLYPKHPLPMEPQWMWMSTQGLMAVEFTDDPKRRDPSTISLALLMEIREGDPGYYPEVQLSWSRGSATAKLPDDPGTEQPALCVSDYRVKVARWILGEGTTLESSPRGARLRHEKTTPNLHVLVQVERLPQDIECAP